MDVVDLLLAEIKDAEADRRQHGWNVWILAVGLAGLMWTGIDVWENYRLDLKMTAQVFVIAIVVIGITRLVLGNLVPVLMFEAREPRR